MVGGTSLRAVNGTQSVCRGSGAQLGGHYGPGQIRSGLSFIGEVPPLRSTYRDSYATRYLCTIRVTGRVQKVAFRATLKRIFGAIKGSGRLLELRNLKDGSVQLRVNASSVELGRLFEYIRAGASFHVVFGTQADFDRGRCVVVGAGEKVPANARYVFTPVIKGVEVVEQEEFDNGYGFYRGPQGQICGMAP